MGLFNYLKNKFSSKKDKEEEKIATEEKVETKSETSVEETPEVKETKVETKEEVKAEETKKEEKKEKYVRGLKKSNKGFMSKMKALTTLFHKVNDEYFDELEEILIEADVGVDFALDLIDAARKEAKLNKIDSPKEINELLVEMMFEGYQEAGENVQCDVRFVENGPTVLFVVGVNGAGKTTTIAKLAKRYQDQGKKILLVAADTFRAGAVEQLCVWADRLNIDIVTGEDGADPSSLCFDGLTKGKNGDYDLIIVDTAGRLQNKVNLMAELSKMKRVMQKVIPDAPHEIFLVIDANTGQNGISQAKLFKEATDLTGIVITKMDGTSKGGIILAIRDELGVPVRFIGLGEAMDDLQEFDLDAYLYGLLIGEEEE